MTNTRGRGGVDVFTGDTDDEVDDLETTLTSLGVVGRSDRRENSRGGVTKKWLHAGSGEHGSKNDVRTGVHQLPTGVCPLNSDGGLLERTDSPFSSSLLSRGLVQTTRQIGAGSSLLAGTHNKGRRMGPGRKPLRNFSLSWERSSGAKDDVTGDEWEYRGVRTTHHAHIVRFE